MGGPYGLPLWAGPWAHKGPFDAAGCFHCVMCARVHNVMDSAVALFTSRIDLMRNTCFALRCSASSTAAYCCASAQ